MTHKGNVFSVVLPLPKIANVLDLLCSAPFGSVKPTRFSGVKLSSFATVTLIPGDEERARFCHLLLVGETLSSLRFQNEFP